MMLHLTSKGKRGDPLTNLGRIKAPVPKEKLNKVRLTLEAEGEKGIVPLPATLAWVDIGVGQEMLDELLALAQAGGMEGIEACMGLDVRAVQELLAEKDVAVVAGDVEAGCPLCRPVHVRFFVRDVLHRFLNVVGKACLVEFHAECVLELIGERRDPEREEEGRVGRGRGKEGKRGLLETER